MAKKRTEKLGDTVDTLRPYLERALTDEEFRRDLKDALGEARKLYGDLSKGNGGVAKSAQKLATDKDVQEGLRKALEDLASATDRVKGKKRKGHKGRNTVLLAGVIVGALYNPWTGAQTRKWVTDKLAGDDDLEPLEPFGEPVAAPDVAPEPVAETEPEPVAAGKKGKGEDEAES